MGFPKSLAGIIGFVLVTGYVISLVMDNNNSTSRTDQLISDMQNSTSQSLNSTGETGGFLGTLTSIIGMSSFFSTINSIVQMGWITFQIALASVAAFVTVPAQRGLPVESYILFAIVFIMVVIAIVKVIWSGE